MNCLRLLLCVALMLPAIIKAAGEANAKYETRVFEVRPDFLVQLQEVLKIASKPAISSDPFAPKVSSQPEEFAREGEVTVLPPSAQALLEKAGVPFPEGSAAFFDAPNSRLHMRHEPLYLKRVEGVIGSRDTPVFITLTAHVIQAPSAVLHELTKPGRDDKQVSDSLKQLLLDLAEDDSKIKLLHMSHVETSLNQKVRLYSVAENPRLQRLGKDDRIAKEVRATGFKLEIDPSLPDARQPVLNMNISLEFPGEMQVSSAGGEGQAASENTAERGVSKSLQTSLQMKNGETRVAALWKDASGDGVPGRADSWQALLLTAHIIQLKPLPKPITQGVKMDLSHISDTISHTFEMPDARWLNDYRYLTTDSFGEFSPVLRKSLDGKAEFHLKDTRHIEIKGGHHILDSFQQWVHKQWNPRLDNIGVTLKILQGPANELRRLVEKSQGRSDHTALLAEAKAMVNGGTARWSSTAYLQSRLGEKAVTSAAREHSHFPFAHEQAVKAPEKVKAAVEPRGTVLEIQPTLQKNGYGVDLQYSLAWQTAARKENAGPAAGDGLEKSGPFGHLVRLTSTVPFVDGCTRLIAAWNSQGLSDVVEIAFVTVDYQHFFSEANTDDSPDGSQAKSNGSPEFETRTFRVWPGFLSESTWGEVSQGPQSPSEAAKKVFESQGIFFPPGSGVFYVMGSDLIEITHTKDQLRQVELFTAALEGSSLNAFSFNLHLFQAEGEMIRDLLDQSSKNRNHAAALSRLLEGVKAGTVTMLDTLRLSSRRAQRGSVQQTQAVSHTVAAQTHAQGQMKAVSEIQRVGSMLEIEPDSVAGSPTVETILSAEFSTAPWITHREVIPGGKGQEVELTDFHRESLKASVAFPAQSTRIFAVWKPTGKAEFEEKDILHIAIMETELKEYGLEK